MFAIRLLLLVSLFLSLQGGSALHINSVQEEDTASLTGRVTSELAHVFGNLNWTCANLEALFCVSTCGSPHKTR
jgi:hypothetical protein